MPRPLMAALVITLAATGACSDQNSDCAQVSDPDQQIHDCTSIIERGKRESEGNRASAYYSRGNAYKEKGELDRAIVDYTNAIALKPKDADFYYNRGNAYDDRGEVDHAIEDYTEAIAIDPKLALAYTNRGVAYKKKGEVDRAIADHDNAIAI